MGRLFGKGGRDPEDPPNGQEQIPLNNTSKKGKDDESRPMTQVMEALFFASGGEHDSEDDTWDPFEGHDEDHGGDSGTTTGGTVRTMDAMDADDGVIETAGMGQALASNSALPPKPPQRQDGSPVGLESKLREDIRGVESTLQEFQTQRDIIEQQLNTAKEQGSSNHETILQAFKRKKEQILAQEESLKELKEKISKLNHEGKVENAKRNYTIDPDKFKHTLFKRARIGRLDDVRAMVKALAGEPIESFIDEKTGYPLMHMALLEGKQDIVDVLLNHQRGKEMAKKVVKTKYCEELTPLYIAIQQGKAENVKRLLRALTPEDVNKKVPNTDYERTFFNELPLAAAVWSTAGSANLDEISEMFESLTKKGANLKLETKDGNTLLHLLVAQSRQSIEYLDYFRKFLRGPFTKAAGIWYNQEHQSLSEKDARVLGIRKLLDIKNKMGFTPLTLAALLESPLYTDLINWKDVLRYPDAKRSQQFSNFDAYDVTNVTSLKSLPMDVLRYNPESVMHVLAHNNVDIAQPVCGKDISKTEPLKSIINLKWDLYHYVFYCWGFLHLLYMCTFTSIVFYFGPKNVMPVENKADGISSSANSSNASLARTGLLLESGYFGLVKEGNPWFILFISFPLAYIIFEIIDHCSVGISKVKCQCSLTSIMSYLDGRISSLFHLTGNGIYRLIGMLFSIFTLIWITLHMTRNVNQDIILSMALLFGWLFCIMFTRTITVRSCPIGIFSIMVQRMLFYDLFPFLIISVFILVGFSSAIHATLLHSEETTTEGIRFKHTLFDMLKYYSALNDGQDHKSSREKEFAKAVLAVFGIISVVLLINMLIAAMNKTYEMVRATHKDLVMRQRLAIILMLERRLPFQCLRKKSEKRFEAHEQKRLLGVVSMKEPISLGKD